VRLDALMTTVPDPHDVTNRAAHIAAARRAFAFTDPLLDGRSPHRHFTASSLGSAERITQRQPEAVV